MKKLLSIVLALALVLSLGALIGCQKDAGTTTETPNTDTTTPNADPTTPGDNTTTPDAPAEAGGTLKDKLDAGETVEVAYLASADNQMNMQIIGGGVQTRLEEIGCTITLNHASDDTATFISMVENYITMGVDAMVLLPKDAQTVQTVVEQAQAEGIPCILYGVSGAGDYAISTRADTAAEGKAIAEMAIAWVEQNVPEATAENPVKCAVLGAYAIVDLVSRTDAMRDTLNANPTTEVVFFMDGTQNSVDSGFNYAQDAMTSDPETRVFCCFNFTVATGVNNYVLSQSDLNPAEFGVFGCNYDSTTEELLNAAANDECVIRGTIRPNNSISDNIADVTIKAMSGTITAPYEELFQEYAWVAPNFTYEYTM